MSGELVNDTPPINIPTVNFELTTEDVVAIKVRQVEKELRAKEDELLAKIAKLRQDNPDTNVGYGNTNLTNTLKEEFAPLLDKIKKIKGLKFPDDEEDYSDDNGVELYEENGKSVMQITITVRRPFSQVIKDKKKKSLEVNEQWRKISDELDIIRGKLKDMSKVEREAKAQLAEWKLKRLGASEIVAQLTGN